MADKKNYSSLLEELLTVGKLARDKSQKPFAIAMLKEFLNHLKQQGNVTSSNVQSFVATRITQIDDIISSQLNEIIHDPKFQKLEAAWLGLYYLVSKTKTNLKLRLRIFNVSKAELFADLMKSPEFDQSELFKKIYEREYGTFGGQPYSCLVGDFEFTRSAKDITLLEKISAVAAAAHAPFISSAHPQLFDLDGFHQISRPKDLGKTFQSLELAKWNSFRNSEDSRYVALVLPRVLMRLPYNNTDELFENGFHFAEDVNGMDMRHFSWGNAAYVLAERITNAFYWYGWTAAIRGVEGGGLVEGLPAYAYRTSEGDLVVKCPTEAAITDRRERELSEQGFIGLCHSKGSDYAVFFGAQTVQRVRKYEDEDANANAVLATRLPYVLAVSRFAHYIKVIMRDKIGSFISREQIEIELNTWLSNYIILNDDAPQAAKAKYPLREGRIEVSDVPGSPGSFRAVVYLRPHFQMEELTASIRLVANLPKTTA
ncbi:MAG: type VI secretion system contractile sheath large subunit [Candidatus Puniceispirillum sp.]|nr:type VI secretion system contractile sheath large subunit [Candidatus Pelagibacter sp.]MBA4283490.1 type VI secretion system contractile sheath large subunit [Candidatus Puniceispirillum sp.]